MPRILVADDNSNIQKMVTLAFQERGIDVVAVGNGEAAVRKIPVVNPDLVLADVFMPVRNGYEVCEFIKKDPSFAHIPVILLVGAFDPLDEKEARRVGADGVLKKPFIPPDPLIAMVMSALEKNPKVAAELAKAKQAKEVIAAAPLPELEIAAKKEPVPLPSFPEPTPDEAAAIYGFGKGVRADDVEQEDAAAKTKARPGEDDEDDEFGAASGSRKWRRAAMDLEIPDDVGNQPAFSVEQDFGPITFPSERDVPPKHIRAGDVAEKNETVSERTDEKAESAPMASAHSSANSQFSAGAAKSGPLEISGAEISAPGILAEENEPASASHASSWPFASADEFTAPISQAPVSAAPISTAPISTAKDEDLNPAHDLAAREEHSSAQANLESPLAPAPTHETQAEPAESHPAPAAHWMDMMAPGPPSEYHFGSWLDAAKSPAESPGAAASSASSASPEDARKPIAEEPTLASTGAQTESAIESAQEPSPEPAIEPHEDEFAPIAAGSSGFDARALGEDRNRIGFSHYVPAREDRSQPDYKSPAESSAESIAEPEPVASAESDFFASEEAPSNSSSASAAESHAEHQHDSGPDAIAGASDFFADEARHNSASHPHAEPLSDRSSFFADEAPHESAGHAAFEDQFRPLHSFLPPAPDERASKDFVTQPLRVDAEPDFFADEAGEIDERIPTLGPVNREELAGIPFLNPSADNASLNEAGSNGADSGKMEAAAQRVLERLQPQLQDLLSQGVLKPLIESLLQQELAKKEK